MPTEADLRAELEALVARLIELQAAPGLIAELRWLFRSGAIKRQIATLSDEIKRRQLTR